MRTPFLLSLLAAGCSASARTQAVPDLPQVAVRTVSTAARAPEASAPGAVVAAQHAVVSTRLSAVVRAVAVQEGTRVRKGALLARLADDDLRGQLAGARSALAAAAAHEGRLERLLAAGQATKSELEAARVQRAQAAAQAASASESLSYAELRAPFDGVVQAKRVSAGDLVGPGQPLFELDGPGLEIAVTLEEERARPLQVGQSLRFAAGGQEGTAAVLALSPGGDPLSHRSSLRARVTKGAAGLRTGDFARLLLPLQDPAAAHEQVWVPQSALLERGDLSGVFVVHDGRAELRWLALGEPEGHAVPVRAGLRAGDEVIDAPGALRDGQPVLVTHGQ